MVKNRKEFLRKKSSENKRISRGIPQINISKILIITEGHVEESYFKAINNFYKKNYRKRIIEIKPVCSGYGTDVKNIIRFAIDEKKKYDSDEFKSVWCVFDTDRGNNTETNLLEGLSQAYKNKIKIAISNPCFEVWILMHYERTSSLISNGQKAKTILKTKIQDYNSSKNYFQINENVFTELLERLSEAITNAELIDKKHNKTYPERYEKDIYLIEYNLKRNRSTHIYKLMREIKKLIEEKGKQ